MYSADFYVGEGTTAQWVGSIPRMGYPEQKFLANLTHAETEMQFRTEVMRVVTAIDGGTWETQPWPHKNNTSAQTDFVYMFVRDGEIKVDRNRHIIKEGLVKCSAEGREPFIPKFIKWHRVKAGDEPFFYQGDKILDFPDMSDRMVKEEPSEQSK